LGGKGKARRNSRIVVRGGRKITVGVTRRTIRKRRGKRPEEGKGGGEKKEERREKKLKGKRKVPNAGRPGGIGPIVGG